MPHITASILYNLVQCPHRVFLDEFGDPAARDRVHPFIELLWQRGAIHEASVIRDLTEAFTDLSGVPAEDRSRLTLEAMRSGTPLIYSGRIEADDLLGVPDLLRLEGNRYIPGDIKSGAGEEGGSDDEPGKPKKHYAVQLALYVDVLERLGLSAGRRGFVWDIHGDEVIYDLSGPLGPRTPGTLWDFYQGKLAEARGLLDRTRQSLPAYGSVCKLCRWYTSCLGAMETADDLTLIPELGRPKRDGMLAEIPTIAALAASNPEDFILGKKTRFPGIGPESLRKLHARAQLISAKGRPYLTQAVALPHANTELFFDIEDDPLRGHVYLHGFVERTAGDNATERYTHFLAEQPLPEQEERAFASAIAFLRSKAESVVYHYSAHERTLYKKLRARYPATCTEEDLDRILRPPRAVDLYTDVVRRATEWPTRDYSVKTLATYLGFHWRDPSPSGAASVRWFDDWLRTGDREILGRILIYNEDDCRAMRVLLDAVRALA